jgi:antitoxin VapB
MMLPPQTQELLRRFAERGSATVEDILAKPAGDEAARHGRRTPKELIAGQLAISDRCAALPVLDTRTPEDIVGYDDPGPGIP